MKVLQEVVDGVLRVRLEGRLTGQDTAPLTKAIMGMLPISRLVIVNFAKVDYVSSSGLGEMVKLYKDIHDAGGAMVIAGGSPRVRSLFELAGMSQLLPFAETENDALGLLKR